MKSLNQLAAEHNYFQANDVPAIYRTERFEDRITNDGSKVPEFLAALNGFEFGIFFKCSQDTNYQNITTYYVESGAMILGKKNGSDVVLTLSHYKGKYSFHVFYMQERKYSNISNYQKQAALTAIEKPNYIGSFTAKKVNDWFVYAEKKIAALDALLCIVNAENTAIELQIETFIKSLDGNCKVKSFDYSNTQKNTSVVTPLFKVWFEHSKDSNHLRKEITFTGNLNDITNIVNLLPVNDYKID